MPCLPPHLFIQQIFIFEKGQLVIPEGLVFNQVTNQGAEEQERLVGMTVVALCARVRYPLYSAERRP